MKPAKSKFSEGPWLPGMLCVLLAVSAAWLAWKCVPQEKTVVSPPTAVRPVPRLSKTALAITAVKGVVPKARPGSTVVHLPDGWENEVAREHPEYLDICAASYEEDIAVDYAPLFRILYLSPEKLAVLMRALVEQRLVSIVSRGGTEDNRATNARAQHELRMQIEAELKKNLPADAYQTYDLYARLPPIARNNVLEIGKQLAFRGQPLTAEQERGIWGVIEAARYSQNQTEFLILAEFYKTGIVNDTLLVRMGAFLTVDQLRIAAATAHERVVQRKLGIKQ